MVARFFYCLTLFCLLGCGDDPMPVLLSDAKESMSQYEDTLEPQAADADSFYMAAGANVPPGTDTAISAEMTTGPLPLPGSLAPDFQADVVMPDENHPAGKVIKGFQLSSLLGKKRVLLMAYPQNCAFVCPTELHALNKKLGAFRKLGYEVLVLSTDEASMEKDPHHSHQAWRLKPSKPEKGKAGAPMGIGNVGFGMVADPEHRIIRAYGIEGQNGLALRATFFIGLDKRIHIADSQSDNIGRDIDELLRKAAAVKFVEENQERVTPEGWQAGDKGMKPSHEGVRRHLKEKAI